MRTRNVVLVAVLAAVAVGLTGCPSDSCSSETPQVSGVPSTTACTVGAGEPVTYQVLVCPACNQSGGTCTADMSQVGSGYIYLDITTQACSGGGSCPPPSCPTGPTSCTFTAPNTPNTTYNVVIPNGQGNPYTRQLQVVASGSGASCPLASAGPTTY